MIDINKMDLPKKLQKEITKIEKFIDYWVKAKGEKPKEMKIIKTVYDEIVSHYAIQDGNIKISFDGVKLIPIIY